MKEPTDDFLKHIKSVLQEHEEPYDEGAWERFASKAPAEADQKIIAPIWKWMPAAAVLIAGFFIARYLNAPEQNTTTGIDDIVKKAGSSIDTIIKKEESQRNLPTGDNAVQNFANKTPDLKRNKAAAILYPASATAPETEPAVTTLQQLPVVPVSPAITQQPVAQQKEAIDFWKNKLVTQKQPEQKTVPTQQQNIQIASNTPEEKTSLKDKTRKWQPSLYVSPVFGEQGVNMGYGFAIGYAVNNKIKISSGIAHTKISTARSYATPAASSSSSFADAHAGSSAFAANAVTMEPAPSLRQVEGSVSGIDIPVELNYNFTKKFYATAGVSGLVVLNDKKRYTYVNSRNVKVLVETNKGNIKEDKTVNLTNYSTTSTPIQTSQETTDFLGFYNFSVGYRQKLLKKNAVSLEPFIKVPVKNVTKQNLNYLGTGIRLKFDF